MKNLRGVYIIWYRDLLRLWHDKIRLIGAVLMPLMFLFVFGSGLSRAMGMIGPGVNFAQFVFPGIIGMTVLMNAFMSGISIVWDREFGFLKEVLVAPINRASVAAGKTLGPNQDSQRKWHQSRLRRRTGRDALCHHLERSLRG